MFAERDHPDEEQHLESAVEVLRLKAYGSQKKVKPLVRRELTATVLELRQIERGNLNGFQAVNPEGAPFALGILVKKMPDVNLGPDASHEETVVFA